MSLFPTNKERIIIQQAQADNILEKLFPIDPYAICAGGAARDWYLGKVATDLDFFIHSNNTVTKVRQQLEAVGIQVNKGQSAEGLPEHYKCNPHLSCVFSFKWNNQAAQVMVMHEPTFHSVIPQFPLSICKAWYKNGRIDVTSDFKRSIKHKVIVKTNDIYNDEHAYLKKILDKFPEYKYYANWELAAAEIMDKED